MFNISDQELEGIEARSTGGREEAYRPMPFGEDSGGSPMPTADPLPSPPASAIVPLPPPADDRALASGAGRALALVTVGLVAGAVAGGAWGAASGVALVGAARNLVRVKGLWGSASAEDRSEAGKSATLGIFGLGLAGVLGYQAYKHRTDQKGTPFYDD